MSSENEKIKKRIEEIRQENEFAFENDTCDEPDYHVRELLIIIEAKDKRIEDLEFRYVKSLEAFNREQVKLSKAVAALDIILIAVKNPNDVTKMSVECCEKLHEALKEIKGA